MMRIARALLLALLLAALPAAQAVSPIRSIMSSMQTVAPAIVQTSSQQDWQGGTTNSSTITLTLASVVAGHDIVVQINLADFSGGGPTCTCNDGSSYTIENSLVFNTNILTEILRLRNVSAGSHSIVCTASGGATNDFGYGIASEVTMEANVAVDGTSTNTNTSTTPTSGSTGTLVQANEIVFVNLSGNGGVSFAGITSPPTTGYTSLFLDTTNTIMPTSFAYKQVLAAPGVVNAAWGTLNSSATWGAVVATFRGN